MTYDRDLIGRIKGGLRVLRPKQIASLTGIPQRTIAKWGREERHAAAEADETVAEDIREALLGRFLGSSRR